MEVENVAVNAIAGVEVTEKIATSAAQFNLVSYLIVEKKLPLPYAANMVTNFMGTSFLLSLLGGFLADTFFGRYYTLIGSACTQMIVSPPHASSILELFSNICCPHGHQFDLIGPLVTHSYMYIYFNLVYYDHHLLTHEAKSADP